MQALLVQEDGSDKHATYEVCDVFFDRIKTALSYFEGNYDTYAYIEWDLVVDIELFLVSLLNMYGNMFVELVNLLNHEKIRKDILEMFLFLSIILILFFGNCYI